MAWLESHQELAHHPKTKKLSRKLKAPIPMVIGYLHLFWWWAMDYAEEGDLSKYEADDIADAVLYESEGEEFVTAMLESGFIEKDSEDRLIIHDWHQYHGRFLDQKEQLRRKKSLYDDPGLTRSVRDRDGNNCRYCGKYVNWKDRKGENGGTYDFIDPAGPPTLDNLVVACRGCETKKGRFTPEQAGMRLIPVRSKHESTGNLPDIHPESAIPLPNLTKHNITIPNKTEDEPYTPEQHLAEIERLNALLQTTEQEIASSAAEETVMDIHRKFFGTMAMSPAFSNYFQKLREKGKSEDFIKEMLQEAGETSNGKPPLRFIQTIAESWIEQGIETREQAKAGKAKSGNKTGSSNNRRRDKPQMPIVTDQGKREMMSKEAYRESVARTFALDGKTLTDAEFEKRWAAYEAKWSVKTG